MSMCGCLSCAPLLGTWPATQAYALTGNPTGDPLVRRLVLNPWSHTSQGCLFFFFFKEGKSFAGCLFFETTRRQWDIEYGRLIVLGVSLTFHRWKVVFIIPSILNDNLELVMHLIYLEHFKFYSLSFFFLKILFIFQRGEGREKERERNINVWLPLTLPSLGAWSATQACALDWELNQ